MKKALMFLTAFLFLVSTMPTVCHAEESAPKQRSLSLKKRQKSSKKEKKTRRSKKGRTQKNEQAEQTEVQKEQVTQTVTESQPQGNQRQFYSEDGEERTFQNERNARSERRQNRNEERNQNQSNFSLWYEEETPEQTPRTVRQPEQRKQTSFKSPVKPKKLSKEEKLFQAIQNKNLSEVEALLGQGANINARHNDVFALEEALKTGDESIVSLLIAKGAEVNFLDKEGRNLYYYARQMPNPLTITKTLIEKKLPLDVNDAKGTPMLHLMLENNQDPELFKLIVKEGKANINVQDSQGETLIFKALQEKYPETFVDLILSYKPNLNLETKEGKTPLHVAIDQRNASVIKKLIEAGADVNRRNSKDMSPLKYAAIELQDPSVLKMILDTNPYLNMWDLVGDAPLMSVLRNTPENLEIIEMLIQAGADVNAKNAKGETPLMYLVRRINRDDFIDSDYVLEVLLNAGAEVNEKDQDGKTPLMHIMSSKYVTVMDDVSLVQMLLDAGADTETENKEGRTALIIATKELANVPLINALLDAGANIQRTDSTAKTPFDYAKENLRLSLQEGYDAMLGRLRLDQNVLMHDFFNFLRIGNFTQIQKFISQGASLNEGDENGDTALFKVIMYSRDPEIIQYMIDNGADVNARNQNGDTPLMKAFIHNRNLEVVSMLLKYGADVNIQNKQGETPLRRAVLFADNPDLIDVLIKAGADPDVSDISGVSLWDYVEKHPEVKEQATFKRLIELTN